MDSFKPQGWHSVTVRLITDDVSGTVEFLRLVFDAEGEIETDRPTEVRIGDTRLMISSGGGLREMTRAFLYVYVADTDGTYARALDWGSEAIEPPSDMPYGDRRATIRDPWGNIWQIATHRG